MTPIKRPRRLVISLSAEEFEAMEQLADRRGITRIQDFGRSVLIRELTLGEWAEESALDTPPEVDEPPGRAVAKTWPPEPDGVP